MIVGGDFNIRISKYGNAGVDGDMRLRKSKDDKNVTRVGNL